MDKDLAFRYLGTDQSTEVFSIMKITGVLALSCLIGVVPLPNFLFGQDSKFVDAAKKEGGKVVIYGSIENDTMDLLAAALKKKTGLEVDYWRDAANKVTDRVASESRAGRPLFDVVLTTKSTIQSLLILTLGRPTATPSSALFIIPESLNRPMRQSRWRMS